jgi:hypothetical protein
MRTTARVEGPQTLQPLRTIPTKEGPECHGYIGGQRTGLPCRGQRRVIQQRVPTGTTVAQCPSRATTRDDSNRKTTTSSVPTAPGILPMTEGNPKTRHDKVQCFNCQGYGHISRYCTQERSNRTRDSRCPGPSQARAVVAKADGPTLLERANTWLRGVGGESEEVKNMILQTMWKSEDFPDA